MSTIMYGIKNCDTIKKARKWLDESSIEFQFHDFRKDGISPEKIKGWINAVGWEVLLNKRGTTWRQLDEKVKANVDEASAIDMMLDNPAIIKRPVLETNGQITVGFKPEEYAKLF
ncbi:MAG: ArsC family reductase [Pseudomonadales bacterium]|nr:ArsC family reductase [Pseudomonadales bacterium]